MAENFGEHLTIDGYGGSADLLDSKDIVLRALNELPGLLGMNILRAAEVVEAPEAGHKDPGGWSGFVIIAESHISIHTFPKRGFLSADVYSCQSGMDQEMVKQFFIDKFGLKDLEVNFIVRGTRYPDTNIY